MDYSYELDAFRLEHKIQSKGALALMVQLTRSFSNGAYPIDPSDYVTGNGGQVAGIGSANLKKILKEHGITRLLASEGGRTSRGSLGLMKDYAELINGFDSPVDFSAIEEYWIERVRMYFSGLPLKLVADQSRSLTDSIDSLLVQARKREQESPGATYVGTVLQHLVAAKLQLLMPSIELHGASVADDQTGREGDFIVGNTAIHCTTAPGDLLMEKCKRNLEHGLNPVVITLADRVAMAKGHLEVAGIAGRVEVWDLQQFVASNVFELGRFNAAEKATTLRELIENYNGIIDECESDPSLRIEYTS